MHSRGILKEHASILNAALHLADWLAIAVTAWLAHWWYLDSIELPNNYLLVVLIALLCAALLFPRFALYQAWRGISVIDEVRAISLAWGSVLLALTAIAFISKTGTTYSRGWLLLWASSGWAALILVRIILRAGLRWARRRGLNQRHVVIVGSVELSEQVAARLRAAPWMGLTVVGYFSSNSGAPPVSIDGIPYIGDLDSLAGFVKERRIDQVWLAMPLRDEDKVRKILHALRHSTTDIRLVPDFFGMRLLNHSLMDIAGMPVINLSVTPMTGLNLVIKAVEDRVLAALILALISPLMVLISVGVKLSSPGPVLFKQLRFGYDGKPIRVYKFRTMVVHEEDNGVVTQASRDDPRVTRFGRFLRRTSLDELPQFFNVLQGRMSIVGPRPHAVAHNEQYKDLIDGYMKRHKVKPGITGWAQINGWRGETDSLEKMQKRVEYDLYYIENWSLWFDLKIILLTFIKGFVGRNAY
ncbi:undecaprenyl-phosphate glucose phosphotransferase [Sulfurivermis fontis]|uniref:undecaprenyl-phosphate glucose phosphotransferase n=1 Tax=Sulfurivermis fontis TaxID=1972068 RepID=UPI000FDAD676|nr:undecaprenyl-phosphate glucose phosphotransferase [Sulfurivermis fontis]